MSKAQAEKAGSLLYRARTRAGLSMSALARAVNTTPPQIDRLEKGERKLTLEWARRLAPALNVEAVDLLFEPAAGASAGSIPAAEVLLALVSLARRCGISDKAAEELADLYLEELQDRQSHVLGSRPDELKVALDRIARRYAPRA